MNDDLTQFLLDLSDDAKGSVGSIQVIDGPKDPRTFTKTTKCQIQIRSAALLIIDSLCPFCSSFYAPTWAPLIYGVG